MTRARRGRKLEPIILSAAERVSLQRLTRNNNVTDDFAVRCRAILLCAEGLSNVEVASRLRVSSYSISKWRYWYLDGRVEGLAGKRRTIPVHSLSHGTTIQVVECIFGSSERAIWPIELTDKERLFLEEYVHNPGAIGTIAVRYSIILRCADGLSDHTVAAELDLHPQTVAKWRRRFLRQRIVGLWDRRKPNRSRTLADEGKLQTIDPVRTGRTRELYAVSLDQEERLLLQGLVRSRCGTGATADRCRIILRCADDLTDREVALELSVAPTTVGKWRRRFVKDGVQALLGDSPSDEVAADATPL